MITQFASQFMPIAEKNVNWIQIADIYLVSLYEDIEIVHWNSTGIGWVDDMNLVEQNCPDKGSDWWFNKYE